MGVEEYTGRGSLTRDTQIYRRYQIRQIRGSVGDTFFFLHVCRFFCSVETFFTFVSRFSL